MSSPVIGLYFTILKQSDVKTSRRHYAILSSRYLLFQKYTSKHFLRGNKRQGSTNILHKAIINYRHAKYYHATDNIVSYVF